MYRIPNIVSWLLNPWVILRITSQEGFRVYLTFDDGPDPLFTPVLLQWLNEHEIKATFFVVGTEATKYPDLMHTIRTAGHSVHLHSWDHLKLWKKSNKAFRQDTGKSFNLLYSKTFRPPYGRIPIRHLCWLRRGGFTTVLWNVDFTDYRESGHSQINIRQLTDKIRSGDIILLHNKQEFSERTFNVLHLLIPELRKKSVIFDRIL
jgi:peptidoglycan-N-acetylglucosamine deacetylase